MRRLALSVLAIAALGPPVRAQERPTADVYIRSQAGLPASSAKGEIQMVAVGLSRLDTALSIVGHRTAGGWRVSYVCAQSPTCDPKHFLLVKEFDLPADAAKRVDAVLDRLKSLPETKEPPSNLSVCGHLAVAIDDRDFKRKYWRACEWDAEFGELERLLKAGLP